MNAPTQNLSDDLLQGADEIATFIYGARSEEMTPALRRRVYTAIDRKEIPAFKIGGIVHARRSSILKAIEAREKSIAE